MQQRLVNIEGYVALNINRYSVPVDWIIRGGEVRETKDKIEIQLDAFFVVEFVEVAEAVATQGGRSALGAVYLEMLTPIWEIWHC